MTDFNEQLAAQLQEMLAENTALRMLLAYQPPTTITEQTNVATSPMQQSPIRTYPQGTQTGGQASQLSTPAKPTTANVFVSPMPRTPIKQLTPKERKDRAAQRTPQSMIGVATSPLQVSPREQAQATSVQVTPRPKTDFGTNTGTLSARSASVGTENTLQEVHRQIINRRLNQVESEYEQARKKLANKDQLQALSDWEIAELQEQRDAQARIAHTLQQRLQELEAVNNANIMNLAQAQTDLLNVQATLDQIIQENGALMTLQGDALLKYNQAADERDKLQAQVTRLKDELGDISALFAAVQEETDAANNLIRLQEQQNEEARDRISQLRQQLANMPPDQRDEVRSLRRLIDEQQRQIQDADATIARQNRRISAMRNVQNLNPGIGMNPARPVAAAGGLGGVGGGPPGGPAPSQAAIFAPFRPATRDSRDYGTQTKFARVMSRELESKEGHQRLDPNGFNVQNNAVQPEPGFEAGFEAKMKDLGIEYVDLTSDTDYLIRILNEHFNGRAATKKALIEAARKDGAWPLVYQPKFGDVTTQKLKNVAFLPDAKTQGRVVNSDLGTVIIPGQSNYTLRREGLNYVVHSAGKKQAFGSAKDASYFISSGGFGRKSYGPVTERVFGTPTKNLSQAIY
jgi:hypothetical protein